MREAELAQSKIIQTIATLLDKYNKEYLRIGEMAHNLVKILNSIEDERARVALINYALRIIVVKSNWTPYDAIAILEFIKHDLMRLCEEVEKDAYAELVFGSCRQITREQLEKVQELLRKMIEVEREKE